jgi:hypothetical protein
MTKDDHFFLSEVEAYVTLEYVYMRDDEGGSSSEAEDDDVELMIMRLMRSEDVRRDFSTVSSCICLNGSSE